MLEWPIDKQLAQYYRLLSLFNCLDSISKIRQFPQNVLDHLSNQYQRLVSLMSIIQSQPTVVSNYSMKEEDEVNDDDDEEGEEEEGEEEEGEEEGEDEEGEEEEEVKKSSCCHSLCNTLLFIILTLLMFIIPSFFVSSYICSNRNDLSLLNDFSPFLNEYCPAYETNIQTIVVFL